jgi:hypothetical protein
MKRLKLQSKNLKREKKTHCRIVHVAKIDWKKVEIYSAKTWSNLMEAKAFSFNI